MFPPKAPFDRIGQDFSTKAGRELFREERYALMHGLEVRSYKVHVSPGHLKSGMSKRLLQMEDGAAAPEIVYRECMMECVERFWAK